jgi:hypothetical protein
MQKDRLQKDFHIRKSLVPILFTIFTLFYFSGCLTDPALKFAQKKAQDTTNYLIIKKVRTAAKQENGDISVCVDLTDLADAEEPEPYTIVLPISSLAKGDADKKVHGFMNASGSYEMHMYDLYPYPSDWKFYLYPVEKAQKGCDKIFSDNFSTVVSTFPIEKINVPITNPLADSHSFGIYKILKKKLSQEEKIYVVRLFSAEAGPENASYSHELINERVYEPIKIHLIYWPSQIRQEQERINPIGLVGGYHVDEGTYLGYVLVPPALLLDLVIAVGYIYSHAPLPP